MQGEELAVAVGLALVLIVAVDLLVGRAVQEVRQQGVRQGVLQVEDAARPAAARSVVDGHGAPLELILVTHTSIGTINHTQMCYQSVIAC